ncbi:hypothetical protein QJS04_geneDACA014998 [Acorus gramineus]|uniref:Uncharacterized protein n=1 Tax=Acorus gramineus TaxID=55184 RepID=A0AAV9AM96_ACOGR|nr:hypothetical protein QJS04_geneDACA014998 [Acorus gramineus]
MPGGKIMLMIASLLQGCVRYFVVDDISKGKDGATKKIDYQVRFDEGKQENCYVDSMSNEQMWRHHELYYKFVAIAKGVVVSSEKFEFCKKYLDSLYDELKDTIPENVNCNSVGEDHIPVSIIHSPFKVRSK